MLEPKDRKPVFGDEDDAGVFDDDTDNLSEDDEPYDYDFNFNDDD